MTVSILTPTLKQVEDDIRRYVSRGTDIPLENVILLYNSITRPNGQYATIKVLSEDTAGLPLNAKGVSVLVKTIKVSVQIFRDNAMDMANKLFIYNTSRQKDFYENSYITFLNSSGVRDLTTLVNEEFEPRASIDFTFTYHQRVEFQSYTAKYFNFKHNLIDEGESYGNNGHIQCGESQHKDEGSGN